MFPALIGAAWAARAGAFSAGGGSGAGWGPGAGTAGAVAAGGTGGTAGSGALPAALLRLLIGLAGLAAVELMNLFGADFLRHRRSVRAGGKPQAGSHASGSVAPLLPGNPVVSERRLPPTAIPLVLLGLAAAGAAALLYFTLSVGPGVLAFLLPAAVVGALYVFSPFPYAFLATALVPPLISGGMGFILMGRARPAVFLAALPVSLVSAGVILTYQVAGRAARPLARGKRLACVLVPYGLAASGVAALLLVGLLPPAGAIALAPAAAFPVWAARLVASEPPQTVPATAVGVLLHSSLSLAVAAAVLFG